VTDNTKATVQNLAKSRFSDFATDKLLDLIVRNDRHINTTVHMSDTESQISPERNDRCWYMFRSRRFNLTVRQRNFSGIPLSGTVTAKPGQLTSCPCPVEVVRDFASSCCRSRVCGFVPVVWRNNGDGNCRTIADSGLDCGCPALDTTVAGISMISAAADDRQPSSVAECTLQSLRSVGHNHSPT